MVMFGTNGRHGAIHQTLGHEWTPSKEACPVALFVLSIANVTIKTTRLVNKCTTATIISIVDSCQLCKATHFEKHPAQIDWWPIAHHHNRYLSINKPNYFVRTSTLHIRQCIHSIGCITFNQKTRQTNLHFFFVRQQFLPLRCHNWLIANLTLKLNPFDV